MSTTRRLLAFLNPFPGWVLLSIGLGIALIACNVGLLGMAAYLIAAAALKPLLIMLTLPIAIVRFMGLARPFARYAERLVSHNVTFRLLAEVRSWVFARLVPLMPALQTAYRSGDLLARLVNDVEELQNVYLRAVSPLLVALGISALIWWLCSIFSPVLAWTALATLVAAGIGVPLLVGRLVRGLGRQRAALQGELSAQIVDSIQGIQDLLAYHQEEVQRQKLVRLDRALARVQRRMALVSGARQALHELLSHVALWVILVFMIPLVAGGRIDGVYLAVLPVVVLAGFEAVEPLGEALRVLGHSLAAGERLFAVTDAEPAVHDPVVPLHSPATASLEFQNVSFSYTSRAMAALDSISLRLDPGQRVAIVGPSGAGKSTIARLALRYWDPTSGVVCLDEQDSRLYALDDVHAAVALVSQDTYLFNDTVRGNLLLARPDAGDDELMQALEQAQLASFVRDLPDGLNTWVGEQGVRLSGGERQRLAIARALLKDAPLLILDEATANLDPLTERALLRSFDVLMHGRTTLMITHRLVAMERMDEIVVLDGGRVVERGTHEELVAANGLYRRLLDLQDGMLALA